jgi:hypothetical protein
MFKRGEITIRFNQSDHDREFCSAIETLVAVGSCPLLQPDLICRARSKMEISMPFRRGGFALTPPTVLIFGISLVLAVVALMVHYGHVSMPLINTSHVFDVLAAAYVVLMMGVLFRGI